MSRKNRVMKMECSSLKSESESKRESESKNESEKERNEEEEQSDEYGVLISEK